MTTTDQTTLPSLYSLAGEHAALLALLARADDSDKDAFLGALDDVKGELTLKADRVAGLMREFESQGARRREEAARIVALAESDDRKAALLKEYLRRQLETADMPALDTPRFRLVRVLNNPAVEIADAALIPKDLTKEKTTITVTPDKVKILARLKAGEVVPGATMTRAERLDVK